MLLNEFFKRLHEISEDAECLLRQLHGSEWHKASAHFCAGMANPKLRSDPYRTEGGSKKATKARVYEALSGLGSHFGHLLSEVDTKICIDYERSGLGVIFLCMLRSAFPPVEIDPAWLRWNDGTVPALARSAVATCDRETGKLDGTIMLVLSDALEDAGCTDPKILSHLRSPIRHCSSCWVVKHMRCE